MSSELNPAADEQTLRMLRALARAIVEELEADGDPVNPADVATRALFGLRNAPDDAARRTAVRRQLEDYVRDLRARPA